MGAFDEKARDVFAEPVWSARPASAAASAPRPTVAQLEARRLGAIRAVREAAVGAGCGVVALALLFWGL